MAIKGALWKKIWKKEDTVNVSLEKSAIKTVSLKSEKCSHCGYPQQKYVPEYAKVDMTGRLMYQEGQLIFYSLREFTLSIPTETIQVDALEKYLIQTLGNGVSLAYDELPNLLAGAVMRDKRFELIIPYNSKEGKKSSSFIVTNAESALQLGSWLKELLKSRPAREPFVLKVQDHGNEVKPNALMPKT